MPSSSVTRSGIKNYARYLNTLSGNVQLFPTSAAMQLIETITVGAGGAASVTFSNLNTYSTTYQHLQIRMAGRSTRNSTDSIYDMFFNSDNTAANYRTHQLRGNGTDVASSDFGNTARFYAGLPAATTTPSTIFGANVIDILDPFSTTKYKTSRALGGSTGYNYVVLGSHLWMSNAAVSSITLDDTFGNFVEGSRFSIYGIRGA